ncbi:MAG TPA: aminotransferase class V-fold PLP-dependent enzyme [Rhizomicrobium sp.]|nr:aminotransferase class V-fold PLP-dependent enzyme [Rhizomicrobium sp.]
MTDQALEQAARHAQAYLAALDRRPAGAAVSLAELRHRLNRPLDDAGVDASQVISELAADAEPGLAGSAGGRFFGWVIGGASPAAIGADWLTSAWDQNAVLYACSPAAAIVEEIAGAWIKEILGLPAQASFAFVTGGQMAHVTCLAAARHALLLKQGWCVEEQGLCGAPPIRILTSATGHGSIARAATLLGLGRNSIEPLAADPDGRVEPAALARALKEPGPAILVLQAGDIATGAYDDFETLIPMAKERGAWVHIDGAFGLWAAASARTRHLLRGVGAADSWATDGHKWLNVPFDSGYAFVADPAAHFAAMSHRAVYLTHDEEARDQIDWTPDWSRRARGFATYAALRALGREGVAELIERSCGHARRLIDDVRNLPGVEIVREPIINQALLSFCDPREDANEADHNLETDRVIAAVNDSGEAFFSGSTWWGVRVMRVSVCNWRTRADDIDRASAAIRAALFQRGPNGTSMGTRLR